mmetsp:Transcript_8615/g.19310  ORF Transcript_8615/g.19310 Transcript_8615/m.19310 type:complete len:232 (+) Transcript_8615:148-843(+)
MQHMRHKHWKLESQHWTFFQSPFSLYIKDCQIRSQVSSIDNIEEQVASVFFLWFGYDLSNFWTQHTFTWKLIWLKRKILIVGWVDSINLRNTSDRSSHSTFFWIHVDLLSCSDGVHVSMLSYTHIPRNGWKLWQARRQNTWRSTDGQCFELQIKLVTNHSTRCHRIKWIFFQPNRLPIIVISCELHTIDLHCVKYHTAIVVFICICIMEVEVTINRHHNDSLIIKQVDTIH